MYSSQVGGVMLFLRIHYSLVTCFRNKHHSFSTAQLVFVVEAVKQACRVIPSDTAV
jgi:hypothetical protein